MPTVLVTGANRGLGFEFAKQYAVDKWNVIACCRTSDKADKLQVLAQTNPDVRIEKLDIADDSSIAALADKLKGTPIDLLINNAGIYSGAGQRMTAESRDKSQGFGSLDSAAWMKALRVNAVAPIMVAQGFRKNLASGKGRKLVMISSRMGSIEQISRGGDIAYRTSKAALNAAMKSISFDLRDHKITVVSFHPGWVQTDMGGKSADLTPEQSVTHIRQTIATLQPQNSGRFLNYDGKPLPW
jgi:NAD(P)-dependent dehydrogenase (short-subunit alcohol dehydrogenase family)